MAAFTTEEVLSVRHWTDTVFSFTATRSPSLRFDNGQFVMMGLEIDGKPLTRAYSLVSSNYDDHLEFLSIKVAHGPLTSRLQHIKAGDKILVGKKPTGTLVLDNLKSGRNLFLLGTGTGLAPFMSLIRDAQMYERFEKIVLLHGCRRVSELAYGDRIMHELPLDEYLGEAMRAKLIYHPTVTREPFKIMGRVTDFVEREDFYREHGLAPLSPEHDRAMVCGGPDMLRDLKEFYMARGFTEGHLHAPGEFVIEKAFVEK